MREIVYGERETPVGKLEYALLETEQEGLPVYGVEITGPEDRAEVPSITPSQRTVLALAGLLLEGAVLPVELPYIVEDWLAD